MQLIRYLTILALLSGCAYPRTPVIDSREAETNKFSLASLQANITKGVSDKSDVLMALGTPNLMTLNQSGEEVYIWDKKSQESESVSNWGASVKVRSQKTIMIAITFNKKGIVKDVTYRSTSF